MNKTLKIISALLASLIVTFICSPSSKYIIKLLGIENEMYELIVHCILVSITYYLCLFYAWIFDRIKFK